METVELKRQIDRAWDQYEQAEDTVGVDSAYERWCQLVGLLDATARDRTTRRWKRLDE